MPHRNTCQIRAGRLLEIRLIKGYETAGDVDAMIEMIREQVGALPAGSKWVTVADWRRCKVMTDSACERAVQMFVSTNARTERAALLIGDDSPTAVMQAMRLINTGENASRRLFRQAAEAASWLGEVLTPTEQGRLAKFLAGED